MLVFSLHAKYEHVNISILHTFFVSGPCTAQQILLKPIISVPRPFYYLSELYPRTKRAQLEMVTTNPKPKITWKQWNSLNWFK